MKKIVSILVFFALCDVFVFAQSGSNDPSFNSTDIGFGYGDGANNTIRTAAIQDDGKIIIAGDFTSYNGTARNRFTRLNIDGTLDNTFNPGTGPSGYIHTISIQSDGKIIIGGSFSSYNGTTRNGIARLNADGTLDGTFNPGTGANYIIRTVTIQSDEKIIIGGDFTYYNGTARNRIARLNADGTLDNTFNPGTGPYSIMTISIQSDGKIIIGGDFTNYNGTARNRIARLNVDGALDNTFNSGTGANDIISTGVIQSDGKIIIGGNFTSYNGTERNRIARLNADGTLDNTFNPGTGVGESNSLHTISIQSDGKIIIGGAFTSYNGSPINRIARLNANGTRDGTFNTGIGASSTIHTISIQSNGKIIIGGSFTSYNGTPIKRIASLNANGTFDGTFNLGTGADGRINITVIQSDGKIIIGGYFTSYNGTTRNRIARLNVDGTLDNTFNPGTGTNDIILTAVIQSDGKIIIGGQFTSYNGTTRNRIARLHASGALDNTFNPGTGANDIISTVVIQSDGKIIIGGQFTSYNGTARNRIARLYANGTLDNTFNPGTGANDIISTVVIQSDGKIIIGGSFTSYNGTARNRIARLNADGTLDNTFNTGTGIDGWGLLNTIAIQGDGKIIIGGSFSSYNGIERHDIARLNADGNVDGTFNTGTGVNNQIRTATIQCDGKIIIGGQFTSYNGTAKNRIARLNADGTLDGTFNTGTGASSSIFTTAIQSDGKIIIGGDWDFTSYNGTGRNRVARLLNNSVPPDVTSSVAYCLNASATALTATGSNLLWYTTPTGGTGSTIAPTPNTTIVGTTIYYVSQTSGCESESARASISVEVNLPTTAAGTISGTANVCQGETSVTYTVPTITNATSYIWTLPSGATGTSTTNSITVSYSVSAVSGNITVKGTNSCSDGEVSTIAITVNAIPPVQIVDTTNQLCEGLPLSFTTTNLAPGDICANYPTGQNSTISGGYILTVSNTFTIELWAKPTATRNTTIEANSGVTGTVSQRYAVFPTIFSSPNAGAGISIGTNGISVFEHSSSYLPSLLVYNTNLTEWTHVAVVYNNKTPSLYINGVYVKTGLTSLKTDVFPSVVTGGTYGYYEGQIDNIRVWSYARSQSEITNNLFLEIPSDTAGLVAMYTYNNSNADGLGPNLTPNGVLWSNPSVVNYSWMGPNGFISNQQNPLISSSATSVMSGVYYVKASVNGCESIADSITILVNSIPSTAGTISGDASVCQGQNSVTYSVPAIANATSYIWALPSGATGTSITNSISVNYGTSATSGNITVKGNNTCGDGAVSTLPITVNPLPTSAGTISGTATVCQGQNSITYNVPAISNATSYVWTLPIGAIGTSTTNSISVNYGASATSGNITIKGNNSCGDGAVSTLPITVNPLPTNAGTISGEGVVCQGQNSVTYSVPAIANATSYVWTLPSGATGTSTTNSITLDYGVSASSGNITVKGTNSCGDGAVSILPISVNIIPTTPNITLNGLVLHSDASSGNQWYDQNGTINGATNQNYTVTVDGNYYVIVSLNDCSSNPSNTINVTGTGIEAVTSEKIIKVYPNPVSNELIIEIEGNNEKLNFEILNAIGQIVFKGNFVKETTIQTSNFAPGVYLIKLENGKTFEFIKVIKE
jgi:uncharacterized delta-60 repeat protein